MTFRFRASDIDVTSDVSLDVISPAKETLLFDILGSIQRLIKLFREICLRFCSILHVDVAHRFNRQTLVRCNLSESKATSYTSKETALQMFRLC